MGAPQGKSRATSDSLRTGASKVRAAGVSQGFRYGEGLALDQLLYRATGIRLYAIHKGEYQAEGPAGLFGFYPTEDGQAGAVALASRSGAGYSKA